MSFTTSLPEKVPDQSVIRVRPSKYPLMWESLWLAEIEADPRRLTFNDEEPFIM